MLVTVFKKHVMLVTVLMNKSNVGNGFQGSCHFGNEFISRASRVDAVRRLRASHACEVKTRIFSEAWGLASHA